MKAMAISFILYSGFLTAQDEPKWMRYPAISPDGQTIAFCYKGDLYRVPASGGRAVALTSYQGHDFRPVWSPDGKSLAFASDRYGNFDVFLIPAQGGQAQRLTFHSADDFPSDFSPDGRAVLFASRRMDTAVSALFPARAFTEVYRVPIAGGAPVRVSTLPMREARYDDSGTKLIYEDVKGNENEWRKHHRSSVTRDILLHDLAAGTFRKLTAFAGEDRNPVIVPGGSSFYYLSEASGSFNVYSAPLDNPTATEQVTSFTHHPVRFLSISDDGVLCFGLHGDIYLKRGAAQPEKVTIQLFRDDHGPLTIQESVTSGAQEMVPSPSGKEVAFVYRGEIFVTSVESDRTRRITDTPEQERSVSFSPDGRSLLYAGERGGSWNLYCTKLVRAEEDYFFNATVLREDPVLVTDAETFQPAYSPDGKQVAYLENRTTLKVLDIETGQSRLILPGDNSFSYADGDQYYQWSPDGKWFLVNFLRPHYWIPEVGLISADGKGAVRNLTNSGFPDLNPKWSMKGSMVLWVSSRDGMKSLANAGSTQMDVYGMFLTQQAFDRFRLNEEDFKLLKEKEEKEEKEKKTKEEQAADQDKDNKKRAKAKTAEEDVKPLTIELEGLRERKVRLTIHSNNLLDAAITPDGEKLLYLSRQANGEEGTETSLWQTLPRTGETKVLFTTSSGNGSLALDGKGEAIFVLAGGKIHRIELASGEKKAVAIKGTMALNPAGERAYLFEHVWRQVRAKFYDPQLHGATWYDYKREYQAMLPHIDNNYDFVELLSELLGELNASHTGARLSNIGRGGDETASLGVFFDESYAGPGLKVQEILEKSPLVQNGSRIVGGTIIEKIDGITLDGQTDPDALLNHKEGVPVLLSLFDGAAGARWEETAKPVDQNELQQMLYERWVEQRRSLTEKLSNGRLGYVHVRSMSDDSFRVVVEEVLGSQADKQALVVDTRYNTGGDLVDDLTTFLNGTAYMDFVPPDGRVIGGEPSRKWTKPSIVLVSEGNYSDAHCFPYAYQALKVGKIVGAPVAGTCTFVWWERLQDPALTFGIPNIGIKVADGTYLENSQLQPDILVLNEPAAVAAGADQQLEVAVAYLLATLDETKPNP